MMISSTQFREQLDKKCDPNKEYLVAVDDQGSDKREFCVLRYIKNDYGGAFWQIQAYTKKNLFYSLYKDSIFILHWSNVKIYEISFSEDGSAKGKNI